MARLSWEQIVNVDDLVRLGPRRMYRYYCNRTQAPRVYARAVELFPTLLTEELARRPGSEITISDCRIRARQGVIIGRTEGEMFSWDSPFGLVLTVYPWDIACIGFDIGPGYLDIHQLQGQTNCGDAFRQTGARKLLPRLLVEVARSLGDFHEVRLIGSAEAYWHSHEQPEYWVSRYDWTAKALGFRWNNKVLRWVKETRTPPR